MTTITTTIMGMITGTTITMLLIRTPITHWVQRAR
jgi:hypothetical protein